MNKLIKMVKSKISNNNHPKKIENLVVLIILLIIVVITVNNIWKNDKQDDNMTNKILATDDTYQNSNYNYNENELEDRLEKILSKIKGVGEVSVLISISQTSEINPVYNEDTKETVTNESDSSGGNRVISSTENSKEIIYEEINGEKNIVMKNQIMPKIEGAIIIAKGGENTEIKSKIINAVQAVTGIETHKIQVFEMNT